MVFDGEHTVGRIVEIGVLREPVEILDEPWPAPEERIGRIKHRNGENVDISFETLQELMAVAREARSCGSVRPLHGKETSFPA